MLLLEDATLADAVVREANTRLAPHQQHPGLRRYGPTRTCPGRTRSRFASRRCSRDSPPSTSSSPARRRRLAVARPAAGDVAEADPVTTLIAGLTGLQPWQVSQTARLSSDLDLDSLHRVEFLGVIEEDLGVFVDDDALPPDATVGELVALVEAARETKRKPGSWSWPLSPAVRAVGLTFQVLLMYPFVKVFYRFGPPASSTSRASTVPSCSRRTTASTWTTRSS